MSSEPSTELFPTPLSNEAAWERLPPAIKGQGAPLPIWARQLAGFMPKTTASLLALDYAQRESNPIPPRLRAAMRYISAGTPLVILTGKEYGPGSSRDWAAKGTNLLGVKAVIAESYERIHRSNLVGMGVLPLAYEPGTTRDTLGLTGKETISITGIANGLTPGGRVTVEAKGEDGKVTKFAFADGRSISVINTANPVAADQNGSTQGASSQQTNLNVVKL
jgi:hypothetical protein